MLTKHHYIHHVDTDPQDPTGPLVQGVRVWAMPPFSNEWAHQFWPRITVQQMDQGERRYNEGLKVQDAFGFLDADQREFLMTGLSPEQFNDLTAEADDE